MDAKEWVNLQESLLGTFSPIIGIALASMIGTAIGLGLLELIRDLTGWVIHLAGDPD